jgi:hypothetical protein
LPNTITPCIEEEYSLCLSYLWRRRSGWRPLFMYFRGPSGVPFFIAPLLTLVGLWRFSRRPRRLVDADPATLQDAVVTQTCTSLGSYGMGGPGFVGLCLQVPSGGRPQWVVFTVWAAAKWLTLNDDLLTDGFPQDEQPPFADAGSRRFRALADLVGCSLAGIRLEHDIAELEFSGTGEPFVLRARGGSASLPVQDGPQQPKLLTSSQDVRDAVVISRRASLWLGD